MLLATALLGSSLIAFAVDEQHPASTPAQAPAANMPMQSKAMLAPQP